MKKLKDLTSKDYKNIYDNYLVLLIVLADIARRIWRNNIIIEVVGNVIVTMFLLCLAMAIYKAWRETGSLKQAFKYNRFWVIVLSIYFVLALIYSMFRG